MFDMFSGEPFMHCGQTHSWWTFVHCSQRWLLVVVWLHPEC